MFPVLTFPLPDTNVPGEIRITRIDAERREVSWTTVGPASHSVWVNSCFFGPENPNPVGAGCGGSGGSFGDGVSTKAAPTGSVVSGIRFFVWVALKGQLGFPTLVRPPDWTGDVNLVGWEK